MATRSIITIDGTRIYSHYDGYPEGMAYKLLEAVKLLHPEPLRSARLLNAFIAANYTNCDLDDVTGGEEYRYTINTQELTIIAQEIEIGTDNKELIYNGKISDFINREIGKVVIQEIEGNLYTRQQAREKYLYHLEDSDRELWTDEMREKSLQKAHTFKTALSLYEKEARK
ncbi:hypothetical protein [Nitratifractor salsuginis]|uniref:Uncharacterized protein n=1 Tax=Nitratifractor salsuginis (strain DSM 16511 / JCM 12458 / E9I37-1) TaxID=749222 RepID=E6WYC2_NITSE|nr:hypothetical protein [Nitratifractor salsuginis]ADV46434.1 hypothetical protein Nitsa_1181 [Nitratifractor salsuginis DSM 16511]